jgi:hypothetical protein
VFLYKVEHACSLYCSSHRLMRDRIVLGNLPQALGLALRYSLDKALFFHSVEQTSNSLILSMGYAGYLRRNQGAWIVSTGP